MRSLISFLILGVLLVLSVNSQTLFLEENFDYGVSSGALVAITSNWTTHSGTSEQIQYEPSQNLTFFNYPSSDGGGVYINGSNSEDVNRTFTAQTSGSIYLSFLISVTNASASTDENDYNVHFNNGTFFGRFYVRNDGGLLFGISKYTESPEWTSETYSLNTTYCIVIKYTIVEGDNNDLVDLFIIDGPIPETEPTPTISHVDVTTNDAPSGGIDAVSLRQSGLANRFYVDGIRVSDSWSQAPLPVELTSFTAEFVDNSVQLNWETATEVNNAGFEVERQNSESGTRNSEWEVLTFIQGHGTTNSPKSYSYTDDNLPDVDNVSYRLKQIDIDGNYDYSKVVEVDLSAITGVEDEKQYTFALEQNYPNPFNPVTTISYTIPNVVDAKFASTTNAKLIVYNMLGQQVQTLVNEIKSAGNYQVHFDGSNLPSGIYFYTLSYGEFLQTRKLVLLK